MMMCKRTAAAVLAALLAFGLSCGAGQAATQAPKSYAALFDEVWKTVDENFYDPSFHGSDWRAIGARYRERLSEARDDNGFSKLANAMLDELHVSHLYLNKPSASAIKGGVGIGARVETIGGDRVVLEVAPLSDAQRQGLKVGERILGPASALQAPLGEATSLQVLGCDGKRRTLTIRHEQTNWPPARPSFEWRVVNLAPGLKLGYVRIDRFDDGAAEMADLAMADLKDTDGLVIDLRQNSGGNNSGTRLVSYFAGGSKRAIALLARPYLQALGRPVTKVDLDKLPSTYGAYTDEGVFAAIKAGKGAAVYAPEDLGPKGYRGKVAVVMGAETASAGEAFAWMMKVHTAATLIGRPTAGYLLSSDRFPLAGGWTLTAPVDGVWDAEARDFRDRAAQPDILVPRTASDECRVEDPDLARAVDVLKGQIAGAKR